MSTAVLTRFEERAQGNFEHKSEWAENIWNRKIAPIILYNNIKRKTNSNKEEIIIQIFIWENRGNRNIFDKYGLGNYKVVFSSNTSVKNTSEEEDNSDYDKNDRDDDYSDNSEN